MTAFSIMLALHAITHLINSASESGLTMDELEKLIRTEAEVHGVSAHLEAFLSWFDALRPANKLVELPLTAPEPKSALPTASPPGA